MIKRKSKISSSVSLKQEFPISGLKWLPYIIGWVFGVFNLLFWLIQLIVGAFMEDKHKFIDRVFHEVIYYYGLVCIALIFVALITGTFMINAFLN